MEMGMIFLMLYKTILFLFQFYTQKPNFEACQVILMSILVLNFSAAELSWWIRGNQQIYAIHRCEFSIVVSSHNQLVQGQQCLGQLRGSWGLTVRAGKCGGKGCLARQCLLSRRTVSKSSNMPFVQEGTFWFLASAEASQPQENTNYREREH